MARLQASVALLLVLGTLAMARVMTAAPAAALCFTNGSVTYQVGAPATDADIRVDINSARGAPDLRIRLVDDPEAADFVLVDEAGASAAPCTADGRRMTVAVGSGTGARVIEVALSHDQADADRTLFVRSSRYRQRDAAALFAAVWDAQRHRDLAAAQ